MRKGRAANLGSWDILKLTVGSMETNCYIVCDPESGQAVIIDPGAEPERIESEIKRHGLRIGYIVNTHGHSDHIGANGFFNAPIAIHRLDNDFLIDSDRNLSGAFGLMVTSPPAARLLGDGDRIEFGGFSLEVIHTPGHTPGSICLKLKDILFTGDTLFCGGMGRTDFPYGDERKLLESIDSRLLKFSDETIIYPGHGPSSTIGEEKKGFK